MSYFRDEVADELVRQDPELLAVVQGRKVMLWRPGQTAALGAQASLMFGWVGMSLALFWLATPSVKTFAYYIAGALVGAAPMNLFNYRMVRGWTQARAHMYRLSMTMVVSSVLTLLACLVGANRVASVMACVGLAFNVLAIQLIASRRYALLSATFRAQRTLLERIEPTLPVKPNGRRSSRAPRRSRLG